MKQLAQQQLQNQLYSTAVIDAKEGRDVMVVDVPNAFVQTAMEPKEKGESDLP